MIGISVSVSSFNINRLQDSAPLTPTEFMRAAPSVSGYLNEQQLYSQYNASAADQDGCTSPEQGTSDSEESTELSRRNSFSLMSINRLRKMDTTQRPRGRNAALTPNTRGAARRSRIRTTSLTLTEGGAKLRATSTSSCYTDTMRTQISRIDETTDEYNDELRRSQTQHSSSSCVSDSPTPKQDSAVTISLCDSQQHEQPIALTPAPFPVLYDDYPTTNWFEKLRNDAPITVSFCDRVAVACASTVGVIFFCFLCGMALCELERTSTAAADDRPQSENDVLQTALKLVLQHSNQSDLASLRASLDQLLRRSCQSLKLTTSSESNLTDRSTMSYTTAFYVIWTAVTTIGYGNRVPISWPGKFLTIIAAIFGVPLFLINATHLANLTVSGFGFLFHHLGHLTASVCYKKPVATFSPAICKFMVSMRIGHAIRHVHSVHLPLSISLAFLLLCPLMTCFVAFAYWSFEHKWTVLEAMYFGYTTLLSIGFGDITLSAHNLWAMYLLGPITIAGIGLYAYMAEMLRLMYLDVAHKLFKIYRHVYTRHFLRRLSKRRKQTQCVSMAK